MFDLQCSQPNVKEIIEPSVLLPQIYGLIDENLPSYLQIFGSRKRAGQI